MSRFLRLTRGTPGQLNDEGLEVLRLGLWEAGKEVDKIPTYSGAPGAQTFRTLANERRGLLEPIPEGVYNDVGGLEWKGNPGDYSASWSEGLGPVVAELYGARAIMLHLDANRVYAPGSAGCVCPLDLVGLKAAVAWWAEGTPEWLEVDWGLGVVGKPMLTAAPAKPAVTLVRHKFFANAKGRASAFAAGKSAESLAMKVDFHDAKFGLVLNNKQIPLADIEAISVEVVLRQK